MRSWCRSPFAWLCLGLAAGAPPSAPDCFAALVATPDLSFSKVRRRQRVQNKEIHRNIRELSTLLYTVGMHHPGVKVVILTDELSAKFVSVLVPRPDVEAHIFVELDWMHNLTQRYPPRAPHPLADSRRERLRWRKLLVMRDLYALLGQLAMRAMEPGYIPEERLDRIVIHRARREPSVTDASLDAWERASDRQSRGEPEEEEEEADVPFFWRRRRPGPDFETRPICKDFMFLDTDMVVLDRMEVDKSYAFSPYPWVPWSVHAIALWSSDPFFGRKFRREFRSSPVMYDDVEFFRDYLTMEADFHKGRKRSLSMEYPMLNRLTRWYGAANAVKFLPRSEALDLNWFCASYTTRTMIHDFRLGRSGQLLSGSMPLPADREPDRRRDALMPLETVFAGSDVFAAQARGPASLLGARPSFVPDLSPDAPAHRRLPHGEELKGRLLESQLQQVREDRRWLEMLQPKLPLKSVHTRFGFKCCLMEHLSVLSVLRRAGKFNELGTVLVLNLARGYQRRWEAFRHSFARGGLAVATVKEVEEVLSGNWWLKHENVQDANLYASTHELVIGKLRHIWDLTVGARQPANSTVRNPWPLLRKLETLRETVTSRETNTVLDRVLRILRKHRFRVPRTGALRGAPALRDGGEDPPFFFAMERRLFSETDVRFPYEQIGLSDPLDAPGPGALPSSLEDPVPTSLIDVIFSTGKPWSRHYSVHEASDQDFFQSEVTWRYLLFVWLDRLFGYKHLRHIRLSLDYDAALGRFVDRKVESAEAVVDADGRLRFRRLEFVDDPPEFMGGQKGYV